LKAATLSPSPTRASKNESTVPPPRVLAYCLLGLLAATIAIQYGFTLWLILSGKQSDLAALDK